MRQPYTQATFPMLWSTLEMNKAIIACAGAGKTYTICQSALKSKLPSLIVTYTNAGKNNIEDQICKLNSGVPCNRITVMTWFHFILHEIIQPYQSDFLKNEGSISPVPLNYFQGIDFSTTHTINFNKANTLKYFLAGNHKLRHNETIILANLLFNISKSKILHRLNQQFSSIYFDEFQDFVGTDIDFIEGLVTSPITITMVGDPKQFTYSTHVENKNVQFTGKNISVFFNKLLHEGKIRIEYKQVSRRFGKNIEKLANDVDPSGELLTGLEQKISGKINGILLLNKQNFDLYNEKYGPQLLIMDKRSLKKIPNQHSNTINFGESKGLTFDNVLIIPNGPLEKFLLKGKPLASPAKYYIAVTRAKYSVAFLVDNPTKYKEQHPDWIIWDPND